MPRGMKAAPPQQASLNELWGSKGKKTSTNGNEPVKLHPTSEATKDIDMKEAGGKKTKGRYWPFTIEDIDSECRRHCSEESPHFSRDAKL